MFRLIGLDRSTVTKFVAAVIGLWMVVSASMAIAASAERSVEIQDLHYGEVLFHFYQQDEFAALTHLLAAREAGRVTHHEEEAELLLGGLYLAYGQTDQATEIFHRLLADTTDPVVRDRAWHFVGKAHYQRGLFVQADEAFARVEGYLPESLRAEHRMLQAQSLMAQSRFDDAIVLLEEEPSGQDWLGYARFNLGVALVRLDRHAEGARQLDRVGRIRTSNPELLALRDKANLALGFAHLQDRQGEQARTVLGRVRLNGLHANKALLGVGWADALQENYRGALTPWLVLGERDLLDSAVQESLLAVPYAFSRLGAKGSAAEYYLHAMASFNREMESLDAAIDRARSGQMIPALLSQDESGIGRWHWQLDELPDSDDARYLYQLVANNQFQDSLRSYRDLTALREHLTAWLDKLAAFENMVETRLLGYARRLPAIEQRLVGIDPTTLRLRRDDLVTTLDMIEESRNVVGLADEREADQWSRLAALETNAAWESPQAEDARDRHRILKGSLLWQLDREYRYRMWQQRRSLAAINHAISTTGDLESRIQFARSNMPLRLEGYQLQIAALKPRIEAIKAQINTVLMRQEQQLQTVIVRELETQKQRLVSYRIQARFALATVYDQTTVVSADPGEATP